MFLDESNNVLLGDFGFASTWSPETRLTEAVGTFPYAAPELLMGQGYVGPEVDIFSIGTVLLAMLSAVIPFKASSEEESFKKVQMGDFEVPSTVSDEAVDLLTRMLDPNPRRRITMEELCQHPWMRLKAKASKTNEPSNDESSTKAAPSTNGPFAFFKRRLMREFSNTAVPVPVSVSR